MKHKAFGWRRRAMVLVLVAMSMLAAVPRAGAYPWSARFSFASPAFQRVCTASDQAVMNGSVSR